MNHDRMPTAADGNRRLANIIMTAGTALALFVLLLLGSCGLRRVQPDAGTEAVLVMKPMIFGHGGIDPIPVSTGSEWIVWTTKPVIVNVQPQQFTFTATDLMSSNGIPLHFDAAIRLQVVDSVSLVRKFGLNWYENNVASEFANRVRQAVRKHDMNSLAIDSSGIDDVDAEVTKGMEEYLRRTGLPVRLIRVTVGKATPPPEIKDQRIQTAAQEQRKLTETKTKEAEDARKDAERSRAVADNAYRQTLNLSPQEFVDLQRIDMQKAVCTQEKANCTFILGNGTPVISTGR